MTSLPPMTTFLLVEYLVMTASLLRLFLGCSTSLLRWRSLPVGSEVRTFLIGCNNGSSLDLKDSAIDKLIRQTELLDETNLMTPKVFQFGSIVSTRYIQPAQDCLTLTILRFIIHIISSKFNGRPGYSSAQRAYILPPSFSSSRGETPHSAFYCLHYQRPEDARKR